MKIKIIADSASEVSQKTAEQWGITVIPFKVRFGDEDYLDGKTISNERFYEKLIETDELPKTSQIPPAEYEDHFRKEIEAGNEVICLTLSSGVSGCYQSAMLAATEYGDRVHVVDTRQFCLSYYFLVEYAVRLRDEGLGVSEILQRLEEKRNAAVVLSVFDTLEYLKAGGRLSNQAAFFGNVLNIKPVVTITDGQVDVIGKARGSKNGNNLLYRRIESMGGVDFSMPVCFGYTGLSDEMLKKYIRDGKSIYEGHMEEPNIVTEGATSGTYAGPGAIAVAFFPKGE